MAITLEEYVAQNSLSKATQKPKMTKKRVMSDYIQWVEGHQEHVVPTREERGRITRRQWERMNGRGGVGDATAIVASPEIAEALRNVWDRPARWDLAEVSLTPVPETFDGFDSVLINGNAQPNRFGYMHRDFVQPERMTDEETTQLRQTIQEYYERTGQLVAVSSPARLQSVAIDHTDGSVLLELYAFNRDGNDGQGFIYRSRDRGQTWTMLGQTYVQWAQEVDNATLGRAIDITNEVHLNNEQMVSTDIGLAFTAATSGRMEEPQASETYAEWRQRNNINSERRSPRFG